jgi:hypothetical protein
MNFEELSKLINDDLIIDNFSIEADWRKQAVNYYKWSKLLAETRYQLNEAKAKLSHIESTLYVDVRVNYDKYNYKNNPTEAAIRSIIVQDNDYMEARDKIAVLTVKAELLSSAVKALEHKKSALDYLNYRPEMY